MFHFKYRWITIHDFYSLKQLIYVNKKKGNQNGINIAAIFAAKYFLL